MRSELLSRIQVHLEDIEEFSRIERITLHYLAGRVRVEALMMLDRNSGAESCRRTEQRFRDALKDDPMIESFDIHWH